EALPAVGFGMGDVVLGELLSDRGLRPEPRRRIDLYLVVVGAEQRTLALSLAQRLRARGMAVAYALRDQAVKKQFAAAGQAGARHVLVIGPEEAARRVARLRDMDSGSEREVDLDALERGDETV